MANIGKRDNVETALLESCIKLSMRLELILNQLWKRRELEIIHRENIVQWKKVIYYEINCIYIGV